MSILDAFVLIVALVGGALAARNLPRLWRNEIRSFDRMQAWWPLGMALWRGWVRGMPLAFFAGCFLLVAVIVGAFVPQDSDSEGFAAPAWYVIPVLGTFFMSLVLFFSVVLVNRPRFVVPPHLRDQPGALKEWLRGKPRD
jgi:hypothetical protein